MIAITRETGSASETEALGAELAANLQPGDLVLVEGDLGAGKTTFVRGACAVLGVDQRVTSPTFVIGHLYAGRIPVAHVDLYRLEDLGLEDPALLEDYLRPDAIAFVEWPQQGGFERQGRRFAARVRLTHAGQDRRLVEFDGDERTLAGIGAAG